MMECEIRMCSIRAAKWIDSLEIDLDINEVMLPTSFGLAFNNSMKRNFHAVKSTKELKSLPVEGVVLAKAGVRFPSKEFLLSLVHAIGCSALVQDVDDTNTCVLSQFIKGEKSFDIIPPPLKKAYSLINNIEAQKLADWLKLIDSNVLREEVVEMHGENADSSFLSAFQNLANLFDSVRNHGCDLCCINCIST